MLWWVTLGALNLFALLLCGWDKRAARLRRWRIPERALWLSALPGSAAGLYAGMLLFRHKTKKPAFAVGVPLLLAAQAFAAYMLLK